MEKIKHQRTQTPFQFIKILIPFSILSIVLSYPLLSNFHILAFGIEIFNFSVGKNYMFLLCNGLLVFIATSSGLIGGFAAETADFNGEKTLKSKGDCRRELQVESSELKGSFANAKTLIPEVEHEEQEPKTESLALLQGTEDVPLILQHEAEEQRPDEELGLMSNEELNKKCEDFIRKMKEGIKLEAQ